MELAWSEVDRAHVAEGVVSEGAARLEVEAGAFADGAGNQNGAPVSVKVDRP